MKAFTLTLITLLSFPAFAASKLELNLEGKTIIKNSDIASAYATQNGSNGWAVSITLKKKAIKKFEKITKENLGKKIDMSINGKLISSPEIKSEVKGGMIVLGSTLSKEEAVTIAKDLSK